MATKSDFTTLVLSGGGVKGLCMLGSLEYIYDNFNMKYLQNFIGTSVGSMIAYLLIIEYTPLEIMTYICNKNILNNSYYIDILQMMHGNGAVNYSPLNEILEKMTIEKTGTLFTLSSLKDRYSKNLVCVTYNNTKNIAEYLSADTHPDMPCLTALRMSSNLPLIFENFKYMGNEYIDGGIVDNFPILHATTQFNKHTIIGVVIKPKESTHKDQSMIDYIYKLLYVPMRDVLRKNLEIIKTNELVHIVPIEVDEIGVLKLDISISDQLEMFSKGFNVSKNIFENLIN